MRTCGVVCVVAIYVQGACHENELRFGQFCAAVRNVLPLNFMCKCSSNLSPKNTQTITHVHVKTHTHTQSARRKHIFMTPQRVIDSVLLANSPARRECQLMSVSSLLDN